MKQKLNEVARMQQIAGISLKENFTTAGTGVEEDWKVINDCFDEAVKQIGKMEAFFDDDQNDFDIELVNVDEVKELANNLFREKTGRSWYN